MNRTVFISLVFALLLGRAFAQQSIIPPIGGTEDDRVQVVLIAKNEATLSSPMTARIETITLEEGDSFRRGDLLFAFDCRKEKARMLQIEARYGANERQYDTLKRLKAIDDVSDLQLAVAEADFLESQAQVTQQKALLDDCVIKAPFDGRVAARLVNRFETIETGKPVMEIVSVDHLVARMLVPSNWLNWLDIGSEVRLTIFETGSSLQTKVTRIGSTIDEVGQTISVMAELDNSKGELLPGMNGNATFLDAP